MCSLKNELIVKEFKVDEIHCSKCKARVEESLKALDGVKKVKADVATGKTVIKSVKEISNESIKLALDENGFVAIFE